MSFLLTFGKLTTEFEMLCKITKSLLFQNFSGGDGRVLTARRYGAVTDGTTVSAGKTVGASGAKASRRGGAG